MRHALTLLTVLFLSLALCAQAVPVRVSPDEAEKHLIEKPAPIYPELARAARIQGNIILELNIAPSGQATVRRLVSGHPMLVQAAIRAANGLKYRPFEIEGKPVPVITLVTIKIGDSSFKDAEARAEMLFEHNFWAAEESARYASAEGAFLAAEQRLNAASGILASSGSQRVREEWQLATDMGELRRKQQKFDDAEKYYSKALAFWKSEKDAPELAMSLANLGSLYADEKRNELARENFTRALSILQKNFKRTGSGNPGAKQAYARAITYSSSMLAKLALERNDPAEAATQCRTLREFSALLESGAQQSIVSACEQVESR